MPPPVWEVYDEWRTARLNADYHAHFVRKYEGQAQAIDVLLALTAPTSAVAALWLWSTEPGRIVWGVVAGVAGLVATVKPFLKLPEKIKVYEHLVTGYRGLNFDLQKLIQEIRQQGRYDERHKRELAIAMDRRRVLTELEPKRPQDDTFVRNLQARINEQLPLDSFFVPKEDSK